MKRPGVNLQDSFLNQARRDNSVLSVELVNGKHLEGRVSGFDNFTLILDDGNSTHLIYKHGISLISPLKAPKPAPAQKEKVTKPAPPQKEKATAQNKVFNDSLKRKLESREPDKKQE